MPRSRSDDAPAVDEQALAALMEGARGRLGRSQKEVARAAGISEDTYQRWLQGRQPQMPHVVGKLAAAVGLSDLEVFAVLGWVDEHVRLADLALVQARARADELERRLSSDGAAAGRVAVAATADGRWQATVAFVRRGPQWCRLPFAHYVAVQRADRAPALEDDPKRRAQARHELAPLLERAVQEAFGTWEDNPLLLPWRGEQADCVVMVPLLHVPRPVQHDRLRGPTALAITGGHSAGATDVASLVASALGYGSWNTTLAVRRLGEHRLAEVTTGGGPDDTAAARRRHRRNAVARGLFRAVETDAAGLVWSHEGHDSHHAILDHLRSGDRRTPVVYLRPDDRLVSFAAGRIADPGLSSRERTAAVDDLKRIRDAQDVAVEQAGDDVALRIHVSLPEGMTPTSPDDQHSVDAFMAAYITAAVQVLRWLDKRHPDLLAAGLHAGVDRGFAAFVEQARAKR